MVQLSTPVSPYALLRTQQVCFKERMRFESSLQCCCGVLSLLPTRRNSCELAPAQLAQQAGSSEHTTLGLVGLELCTCYAL